MVFDAELTPQTVSLPPNTAHTGTVAAIHLTSRFAALDDLERLLPATEFTPSLGPTAAFLCPGVGMADASAAGSNTCLATAGWLSRRVRPGSQAAGRIVFARERRRRPNLAAGGRAGADLPRAATTPGHTQDDGLALSHSRAPSHPPAERLLVAGDKRYAQPSS
jgi:hypothetical protein